MKLFQKLLTATALVGSFAGSPAFAQQSCLNSVTNRDLLNEVSKRMRRGGSDGSDSQNTINIACRGSVLDITSSDRDLVETKLSIDLIVNSMCAEARDQMTVFFRKSTPGQAAIGAICRSSTLIKVGVTADGALKKVSETDFIVNSRCVEARNTILGIKQN